MFLLMLIAARGAYLTHEAPGERVRDEAAQREETSADGAPHDWGIRIGRTVFRHLARPAQNSATSRASCTPSGGQPVENPPV